jgi:hemin uptake protein HemP
LETCDGAGVPMTDSPIAQDGNRAPHLWGQTRASSAVPLRMLDSADLLQGAREVQIRHDEKIYRLQVTRNGKLILIK